MSATIYLSKVRALVSRDVSPEDHESVDTLNDLPSWMIEELKKIATESRLAAMSYLNFYVRQRARTSVADFIQDVVEGGQDARTWGIHDWLYVRRDHEPTECLAASVDQLRSLDIEGVDGARWFRFSPRPTRYIADDAPGAIGVLYRRLRYWQRPAHRHDADLISTECGDLEPVPEAQLAVSLRRWIGRRLAWWSRSYLAEVGASVAAQGILDSVSRGKTLVVTRDAQIAAAALAREAREHGAEADFLQRAGFLGPDAWYDA